MDEEGKDESEMRKGNATGAGRGSGSNSIRSLKDKKMHYCIGCGHTAIQRIIAEVIDELGIREKTIASAPVGCSVLMYNYFNFDIIECAHGRVPSVMTAIKRCLPDRFVLAYQGDGDLAAIGTNETIHTANRGENISVIFVNNAIYGMTGGQMAPTTIHGQKTTTTPSGRGLNQEGPPLRVCEMIATLDGPAYIERVALTDAKSHSDVKEALRRSFLCQMDGKGYSLIEILSACPTNWKQDVKESIRFVENMKKVFPTGVYKDIREDRSY